MDDCVHVQWVMVVVVLGNGRHGCWLKRGVVHGVCSQSRCTCVKASRSTMSDCHDSTIEAADAGGISTRPESLCDLPAQPESTRSADRQVLYYSRACDQA